MGFVLGGVAASFSRSASHASVDSCTLGAPASLTGLMTTESSSVGSVAAPASLDWMSYVTSAGLAVVVVPGGSVGG